ncbi:hypothetical protein [Magnetospira sp. QH-2]|uniref:hypothetical protein n=1 Tax=Magnetospira sp. (strain QH-2) TaxID=1288970 RepID=UPI0003E80F22|nr:hypothetical protein [Magnetospira sp. QH-2]CCQ73302.1 Conserved protein of unknown function [Magnetospira sp. QH-2]
MTVGDMDTTTRLDRAQERLDKALARLDAALQKGGEIAASTPSQEVAEEISRLNEENARLREATHSVSRRLDSTISRLKAVLEG